MSITTNSNKKINISTELKSGAYSFLNGLIEYLRKYNKLDNEFPKKYGANEAGISEVRTYNLKTYKDVDNFLKSEKRLSFQGLMIVID